MVADRELAVYHRGGVLAGVFSALLFGISAFLYTYCIPVVSLGNTVGCVFPHQLAATIVLLGGFCLLIAALVLITWRTGELGAWRHAQDPISCPDCGTYSPSTAVTCAGCGRYLVRAERTS